MPNFVFLWTDIALFALVATVALYAWQISRSETAKATWSRVARSGSSMSAGVVLLLFVLVGLLDSVHFQPRLPPAPDAPPGVAVVYSPQVVSLLDTLLSDTALLHKEKTFSAPLGWLQFTKETILQDGGEPVRDFPRLKFGGSHLDNPEEQWLSDVLYRASVGGGAGLLAALVLAGLLIALISRTRRLKATKIGAQNGPENQPALGWGGVLHEIWCGHSEVAWRPVIITMLVVCLLLGVTFGLASGYHVFGTDRTGNDVLWQALKSIRTAWVIGSLTTVAMLPPAIIFGLTAGYFKGWVDDVIQYIYTTLTAIPGVLLIAAAVLMMQVYIDTNPELFPTAAQRADLRLFLLCMILGLTGWAGLCRLLRAEALKLRELEYVQASRAFGISHLKIIARHLLPNVMHIVLITIVLEFSGLVLYEAVLSYLGIGVDPTMNSFGTMIDKSRLEMSRDPMIWWTLLAAFVFMLTMVLAANLFADGVRDAFDPRSRGFRPTRRSRLLAMLKRESN